MHMQILIDAHTNDDVWKVAVDAAGEDKLDGRISWCDRGHNGCLVARIQYCIDSESSTWSRRFAVWPECFTSLRDELPEEFPEFQLKKLLSPGDCIGTLGLGSFQRLIKQWVVLLRSNFQLSPSATVGSHGRVGMFRIFVRRDYPCEHEVVYCWAPLSRLGSCLVSVFAPHPTEPSRKCLVSHISCNACPATKATSLFAQECLEPHYTKLFTEARELMMNFMNHPKMNKLRDADESMYMVLNLKSCPRGPPLLPDGGYSRTSEDTPRIQSGGMDWIQPDGEGFQLTQYLITFLNLIHCPHVDIFDELEGKRIVPYQTILRRSHWESVQHVFLGVFKAQQSAYRKLAGIANAPRLTPLRDVGSARWRVAEKAENTEAGRSESKELCYTVRNTFVDEIVESPMSCCSSQHSGAPQFPTRPFSF